MLSLIVLSVSHPANPVAQPLPSDSAAADAIGRLPIAASLPAGVSISRYLRDVDQETFVLNIQQRYEWTEVSDDPAFAELPSDCDVISISELVSRRNKALAPVEYDDEGEPVGSDYGAGSDGQGSDYRQDQREYSDYGFPKSHLQRKNSSRNSEIGTPPYQDSAAQPDEVLSPTPGTEEQRLAREQEERLAALGVTGVAKPVQPSMRRTVAVTDPPKEMVSSTTENSFHQAQSIRFETR